MIHADDTGLKDSVAYRMLAWRHRHRRIGVFAIAAKTDGEPARAWAECRQCAAMFEFVCDEVWQLAEGEERMCVVGPGGAEAAGIEAAH
jgi:hypothetical protein